MDIGHVEEPVPEEGTELRFPTGVIVAALFAAWIGLMALAITNIAADVNDGFKTWITLHSGIGPYSGKEVFLFASWFVSWPFLHFTLRTREVDLRRWFGVFLVGMLIATILMWPPIFEAIADALKG